MPHSPVLTDRYLVLLCPDRPDKGVKALADAAQLTIAPMAGKRSRKGKSARLPLHCAIIFDRIGVALVRCTHEKTRQLQSLTRKKGSAILAVEPERTVYASASRQRVGIPDTVPDTPAGFSPANPGELAAYLRGYRDAIDDLSQRLSARTPQGAHAAPRFDDPSSTWGVQAIAASTSPYTGKGIRLAVLDTGLDQNHADFAGRRLTSRSFIASETAQDSNGHGTHCAGIAAGPATPASGPRYGVAGNADLFIGKVLGDDGSGGDGGVLEGINWAIENNCQIVSMSLGSPAQADAPYSRIFEEVARRALAAGTTLIAAAGNDSERPAHIAAVAHPANCPSILAVGALDAGLDIAPFSNGGLQANGGNIDITAPGVDILSAWPSPKDYNTISGTSMATPFVAGAAALYAEADEQARGAALASILKQQAASLPLPERDAGAGIVQAP